MPTVAASTTVKLSQTTLLLPSVLANSSTKNLITWCYKRVVLEIGRCTVDKLSLPELTPGKMKTIKQQGISLVKYFISYTSRQYNLSSCSSCFPDFQLITFGPPPCIFRALTVPTIIAHSGVNPVSDR